MSTAQDIVDLALGRLGVVAAGEAPKEHQRATVFQELINLIAMLSTKEVLLPYRTKESFTLSANVSSVTIGDGSDLDTDKPVIIEAITIRDSISINHHLSSMSRNDYKKSYDPSLTTIRPTKYHYEPGVTDGTILFDHITADAETIYITSIKEVTAPINLSSNINLPPEYISALSYNLPVFCADFFPENNLSQITMQMASSSIKMIENKNLSRRIPQATIDNALKQHGGQRYNIDED